MEYSQLTTKKLAAINSYFLIILIFYILGSIFYIFRSGLPQPADIIMAIGIGTALIYTLQGEKKFFLKNHVILLLLFAFYAMSINLVNYMFLPDIKFLLSSMYYIYNVSIFLYVSYCFLKFPEKFVAVISNVLVISVFVELAIILFVPSLMGVRQTGTFNNPNQLAYWSILTTSMIAVLRYNKNLRLIDIIAIFCLGFIIMLSLSKAGMICYALLVPAIFISKATTKYFKYIGIFALFLLFIFLLFQSNTIWQNVTQISALNAALLDLESTGTAQSDNPAGRGYLRIIQNPEYLITGAGEGGYIRFVAPEFPYPIELHSGLGSLLFCYGIFGTFLFFIFLFSVFRKTNMLFVYTLMIITLYGVVHQNFRFSTFWVYLACVYGVARSMKNEHIIEEPVQYPIEKHYNF